MIKSKVEVDSYVKALNSCLCSTRPDRLDDNKGIWVQGLAKVKKSDGSLNFCRVVNDGFGKPVIMEDFGNCATIVRVIGIYPTIYLPDEGRPNLRNKGDILRYLTGHGEDSGKIKALMASSKSSTKKKASDTEEGKMIEGLVRRYSIKDFLNIFYNKNQQQE